MLYSILLIGYFLHQIRWCLISEHAEVSDKPFASLSVSQSFLWMILFLSCQRHSGPAEDNKHKNW